MKGSRKKTCQLLEFLWGSHISMSEFGMGSVSLDLVGALQILSKEFGLGTAYVELKITKFCFNFVWMLLLSHFSHVRLCATPSTAAHQAPPSLGFSRQEHWSGLPFPSPMHEREKWKWSRLVVSDPQRPHGLQPSRLLYPWDFPGKSTGVGCHCMNGYPFIFLVSIYDLRFLMFNAYGHKY